MTEEARIRELERELQYEKTQVAELHKNLKDLETRFEKHVFDQQDIEAKRLRTALIWAGGLILALGSFIFSEIIWPVINSGRIK